MALPSITAGSTMTERSIPLRVAKRRRHNVRRNLVIITVMVALTLLITLAGRDQQDVRNCRARLERVVADFPLPSEAHSVAASHYTYRPDNLNAESSDGPTGVSCCAAPHGLFLDTDGRHVVIYDGRAFEIRWMTETEFQRQAEGLGLAGPAD